MARVHRHVVFDAFVNHCCLESSHSWNPIWPQGLPFPRYIRVALHTDPEHFKATKGGPQPFLTLTAIEEYLVNDDPGPAVVSRKLDSIPSSSRSGQSGSSANAESLNGRGSSRQRTTIQDSRAWPMKPSGCSRSSILLGACSAFARRPVSRSDGKLNGSFLPPFAGLAQTSPVSRWAGQAQL